MGDRYARYIFGGVVVAPRSGVKLHGELLVSLRTTMVFVDEAILSSRTGLMLSFLKLGKSSDQYMRNLYRLAIELAFLLMR